MTGNVLISILASPQTFTVSAINIMIDRRYRGSALRCRSNDTAKSRRPFGQAGCAHEVTAAAAIDGSAARYPSSVRSLHLPYITRVAKPYIDRFRETPCPHFYTRFCLPLTR